LPEVLDRVERGEEVDVLRRGLVIAHLVPKEDAVKAARLRLAALRKTARIHDVESPLDVEWNANDGRM